MIAVSAAELLHSAPRTPTVSRPPCSAARIASSCVRISDSASGGVNGASVCEDALQRRAREEAGDRHDDDQRREQRQDEVVGELRRQAQAVVVVDLPPGPRQELAPRNRHPERPEHRWPSVLDDEHEVGGATLGAAADAAAGVAALGDGGFEPEQVGQLVLEHQLRASRSSRTAAAPSRTRARRSGCRPRRWCRPRSETGVISSRSTSRASRSASATGAATKPPTSDPARCASVVFSPSPRSLIGRLKMMSERMSPSSSGGVLDSSSSGRCASPWTRTRASTPETSRRRRHVQLRVGRVRPLEAHGAVAAQLEAPSLELVEAAHGVDGADDHRRAHRPPWSRAGRRPASCSSCRATALPHRPSRHRRGGSACWGP